MNFAMKIGILNGGGDCAGLNAVTRAAVKRAEGYGWDVLGIRYGWDGFFRDNSTTVKLTYKDVHGIVNLGGTILKSSRANPAKRPNGLETVIENSRKLGLDALITVGGDDTLRVANELYKRGLRVVGVPKTMDNDLSSTDFTFGFDSAINEAMHAIDNLKRLLVSGGQLIIIHPLGENLEMDKSLIDGTLAFDKKFYLRKIGGFRWNEVELEDVRDLKYDSKTPSANGIIIAIFKKD